MSQGDLFTVPLMTAEFGPAGKLWRGHQVARAAYFSPCGTWRYALSRIWALNRPVAISAGLNPSTADAYQDDPTINSESTQFDMMGFGGLLKLNIFAFKATDPKVMRAAADPVGPENDRIFERVLAAVKAPSVFVATWGLHGRHRDRDLRVLAMLKAARIRPMCFAITLTGMPRHPLYLPHGAALIPYPGRTS